MKIINSLLYLAVLITGCQQPQQGAFAGKRDSLNRKGIGNILEISKPIEIKFTEPKDALVSSNVISEDHKFIQLETLEECLIGKISKVIVSQNKIYVLDNTIAKKLYCFDISGRYLYAIGTQGEGPGESDTPEDFDVTGDKIFVIDRQYRLFVYDRDGKYTSYIRMPIPSTQLCVFDDNSLFFYTQQLNGELNSYLTQIDLKKNAISADFPIQSALVGNYGINQAFSRNGKSSLFIKFLSDTVFTLNSKSVKPKYILKYPGKQIDHSVFVTPKLIEKVDELGYANPIYPMNFIETDDYFLFMSRHQGKILHNIFNRKTLINASYKGKADDLYLGAFGESVPVGQHENYIIFPLDMQIVKSNFDKISNGLKNKPKELQMFKEMEIYNIARDSSPDDNPRLLLTKINPSIYGR